MKKGTVKSILMLGIFYFVFLGAEYYFDNMMAFVTDADGVVLAQSYILGSSVLGFLLYAPMEKMLPAKIKQLFWSMSSAAVILMFFFIKIHSGYGHTLRAGLFLFLLLGYFGSGVHYLVAQTFAAENETEKSHLARTVGCAYAFGILLQFINNNCISSVAVQVIFLCLAFAVMEGLFMVKAQQVDAQGETHPLIEADGVARKTGMLLIFIVALMTFIFATLDNAVTLVHAGGGADIGQWPRLLLACSGLLAGFLYDIEKGAYQNIIMYCVMMLSTICVVVITCGGPFILGLVVFYLSAGFFSIYFASSFMRLSYVMKEGKLWAGLGRAVNNLCAVGTASMSLALLHSPSYVTIVIALVLFAITSVLIFVYQRYVDQMRWKQENAILSQEAEKTEKILETHKKSEEELLALFAQEFSLTPREVEVLACMLHSEDNVTEMATQLAISRAALYRHISNMNEKTNTKARIGLLQFYYAWMQEK